jgi:putative transposase
MSSSEGRVGSALDNAAAESYFSTPERERLSRRTYATKAEARADVARWIDGYDRVRRHSGCDMKSPIAYEIEDMSASEHARGNLESDEAA